MKNIMPQKIQIWKELLNRIVVQTVLTEEGLIRYTKDANSGHKCDPKPVLFANRFCDSNLIIWKVKNLSIGH